MCIGEPGGCTGYLCTKYECGQKDREGEGREREREGESFLQICKCVNFLITLLHCFGTSFYFKFYAIIHLFLLYQDYIKQAKTTVVTNPSLTALRV